MLLRTKSQQRDLKIRLVRLRHWLKAVVEMVVVVFGADVFAQRTAVRAPVTLDGIPWHREGARIFDVNIHLESLAVVDQVEALYNMQLFGMRRLIVVDVGLVGDSDRIDHQRVALIMTDRLTVP